MQSVKTMAEEKMKSCVEECYGKEEASKFKGSQNWFQRFKKRHGISFRRRTNKKKQAADDGRQTIQKFHRDLRLLSQGEDDLIQLWM